MDFGLNHEKIMMNSDESKKANVKLFDKMLNLRVSVRNGANSHPTADGTAQTKTKINSENRMPIFESD